MKEIKNFLALAKEKIAQQLFNSNSTIEKAGLSLTKYYGNNTFLNYLTFSVLAYKNRNISLLWIDIDHPRIHLTDSHVMSSIMALKLLFL